MDNNLKDRRSFLKSGLIGTAAMTVVPKGLLSQVDDCDTTALDFYGLGPFYSAGAPARFVLAAPEEAGERLFLTGIVYANDCVTPLGDVVLDIWHADDSGCYSRFENCENPSEDEFKLRGVIRTGSDGRFGLETIKPGHYLNGSQFRPSHIHLIVRYPGANELVTQLYFEGDPYISIDAAASRPDAASRIIPLVEASDGLHGHFDLVLNVEPTSSVNESANNSNAQLRQNHPNPFSTDTRVPYSIAKSGAVLIAVYDLKGRLVKQLIDRQLRAGTHFVDWNGLDSNELPIEAGTYFLRMQFGEERQMRVMTKV